MAGMVAADAVSLYIEGIMEKFPELVKSSYVLESRFKSTRAKKVSTKAFRLPMKYSRPEQYAGLSLDAGTLPLGDNSKWNQGTIVPFVGAVATNWTELVALVGRQVDGVAIRNIVDTQIADVADQVRNWRNKMLHTAGKGTIGIVSSVNAGTNVFTLSGGFGARLLGAGLTVEIVDPATDLTRGNVKVDYKSDFIGGTQTFGYTGADVAGATANDLVRIQGLTDGAPIAIYGLPYFINGSTTGTLLGITKLGAPYVVSNALDAASGQLSLPMFEALMSIIQSRLENQPMAGGFIHTHRSQLQSYKELGFALQTIPMPTGHAPNDLDLFFGGKDGEGYKMSGYPVTVDDHADNSALFFVQPDGWGRVSYADPFWYEANKGSKIYPIYDGTTGTPKTQYGATMIDSQQFFCDNVMAQGVISGLALPVYN